MNKKARSRMPKRELQYIDKHELELAIFATPGICITAPFSANGNIFIFRHKFGWLCHDCGERLTVSKIKAHANKCVGYSK